MQEAGRDMNDHGAEIALTDRTLRLGHEVYQLSNISRISRHRFPPPEPKVSDTGTLVLTAILSIGILLAVLLIANDYGAAGLLCLLVTGGCAIWAREHFKQMFPWLYGLSLESAGVVRGYLLSDSPSELEDLEKRIIYLMNSHEPVGDTYITHFNGDIVTGDKIRQEGLHNQYIAKRSPASK